MLQRFLRQCKRQLPAEERLEERMPFPVKAIQVDGGSGFGAKSMTACAERGTRLSVLPPRSPKLNGTWNEPSGQKGEEFYACYDGVLDLKGPSSAMRQWERVYNTP